MRPYFHYIKLWLFCQYLPEVVVYYINMIADITITEKSFGPKVLMTGVKFSIDDGEKVGVVGRNGVGKSTLFGILAGTDKDFTGDVIYKRGVTVVATSQEHHGIGDQTVLQYILQGLPEYAELSHIVETYPMTMDEDMAKIEEYTAALQRFDDKGFYQIEEKVERELDNFQLTGVAHRPWPRRSSSTGCAAHVRRCWSSPTTVMY